MANVKITELSSATTLGSTDVFPVVDVGSTQTRKVTVADLLRNTPDGTASAPSIANAGDQDTGIYFPAENNVGVSTGGTQRLVIDNSGNVGIGTTSPSEELEVQSSTNTTIRIDNEDDSTATLVFHNTGSTDRQISVNSGSMRFGGSSDEQMRIDSSGRVGIGTTSPLRELHVANSSGDADLRIESTNTGGDARLELIADNAGVSQIRLGDQDTTNVGHITYDHSDNNLNFKTNNSERLRVDSSGRLLVGTTTEGAANADDLTLATTGHTGITIRSGTSSNGNIYFSDATTGTGEYSGYLQYRHDDNALAFGTLSSERMRIDSSGNVKIGTGSDRFSYLTPTTANLQIDGGIVFEPGSGNDVEIINYRSTGLVFGTSGAEKMRIDSSGKVGIGTSSPSVKLHVAHGTDQNAGTQKDIARFIASTNSPTNSGGLTIGAVWHNTDVNQRIAYLQSEQGLDPGNTARRLSLNPDGGNVGIGTASPTTPLQVHSSTTASTIRITNSTSGATSSDGLIIQENGNDAYIWNKENSFVSFGTNNAERMRIDSSGRVGIGTTSPTTILQLEDNISGASLIRNKNTSTNASSAAGIRFDTASDGTDRERARIVSSDDGANKGYLAFETRSTSLNERLRIDGEGALSIFNGTAPTASATNGVKLYAEDVSSSSELKVRDEAGNVTTLSPHNFDLIPEGPSEDMAWSYYSEKDGKRINVDMLKAVRLLEQLTGEQLVFTG